MIKGALRLLYRLCMLSKYRRNKVFVDPTARFNRNTFFEGCNKVKQKASLCDSTVGKYTYIGAFSDLSSCRIGAFSSISHDVYVEPYTHPSKGFISTSPVFFSTLKQAVETFVEENLFNEYLLIEGYKCIIGNDVWIGSNVLIKGGVKIGDGAIIAMGRIVTKDVPPYAIVAGVPAKIIRYRYSDAKIQHLMEFKWWNKDVEWIKSHARFFADESRFFNLIDKGDE